jgi:hypothetical protein
VSIKLIEQHLPKGKIYITRATRDAPQVARRMPLSRRHQASFAKAWGNNLTKNDEHREHLEHLKRRNMFVIADNC